jgi:fermentation-respiration switch protein FrsA (DUF1100 family)
MPDDEMPNDDGMPTREAARRGTRWGRLALFVILALSFGIGTLMLLEDRLIFLPSQYPIGNWQPAGLDPEDAWFQAADGVRLHGWYLKHLQPRGYLVFCHGNAGNITHRAEIVEQLRDRGRVSVLLFDYRGYGRSAGHPSEAGVLADARAARQWLAHTAGIEPGRVIVCGESIGGAVAVDLAADGGARGLILENTFTSLPDVAAYHMPWVPCRWLMHTRLDSLAKIGRYHGPLLQSHGDPDSVVPFHFGKQLFEAANEPKRFMCLQGYDHNDPRPPSYYDAVGRFIAELP